MSCESNYFHIKSLTLINNLHIVLKLMAEKKWAARGLETLGGGDQERVLWGGDVGVEIRKLCGRKG